MAQEPEPDGTLSSEELFPRARVGRRRAVPADGAGSWTWDGGGFRVRSPSGRPDLTSPGWSLGERASFLGTSRGRSRRERPVLVARLEDLPPPPTGSRPRERSRAKRRSGPARLPRTGGVLFWTSAGAPGHGSRGGGLRFETSLPIRAAANARSGVPEGLIWRQCHVARTVREGWCRPVGPVPGASAHRAFVLSI